MRRLVLLLALVLAPITQPYASSSFHDYRPLGDAQLDASAAKSAWTEFEALQKAAPARLPDQPIGQFTNGNQKLLLAPDGRAALYFRGGDDGEPDSAWMGQYQADGEWLQLDLTKAAVEPATFDSWWAQVGAERIAWQAEMDARRKAQAPRLRRFLQALESDSAEDLAALSKDEPDEFPAEYIEELAVMDTESRQSLIAALKHELEPHESEASPEDASPSLESAGRLSGLSMRLLPTPHGDGWLLVDEATVESMANTWNQYGRAFFSPKYWNDTPGPEEKIEHGWRQITYKAPLPANLPSAFTGLLFNAPRLVTVSEWLDDPAEPVWKAHEATLRVRVDFSSTAGARSGMTLHGIAPDERWLATLTEVDEHGAMAALTLKRFSPWDSVELPTRGLRFSTRSGRIESETCGVDTSAAVKAQVTKVLGTHDGIEWDADGFAFVRLRIDQGSAHGLIPGDELSAEDYAFGPGEGRIETVESQQAVVLWRLQRYHPSMEVEAPSAGTSLVTPAWRRASYDTFGKLNAGEHSSVADGMQDAAELH